MGRSKGQDDERLEQKIRTLHLDATDRDTLQNALQELQVHQIELGQQNLLGCDLAQGYLISRPKEATDMASWMQQRGV